MDVKVDWNEIYVPLKVVKFDHLIIVDAVDREGKGLRVRLCQGDAGDSGLQSFKEFIGSELYELQEVLVSCELVKGFNGHV